MRPTLRTRRDWGDAERDANREADRLEGRAPVRRRDLHVGAGCGHRGVRRDRRADGAARRPAARLPGHRVGARPGIEEGHHGVVLADRGRRGGVEAGGRARRGPADRPGTVGRRVPPPDRDRDPRLRFGAVKAIVCEEYGPPDRVLRLTDVDDPVAGDGQVLVRVRATSVNPADWHFVRGEPYLARLSMGLRKPKYPIMGCDLAGTVEAVGPGVTALKPGDEVYGSPFMEGFGGFAELAAVPEDVLVPKPPGPTFEQAAAVPMAGLTALQGVRDQGRVEAGQRVLIIGAAGGVGTFAVQIAKALGAEVTGVCSTGKVDLVRSLGADRVVDYTTDDLDAETAEPYDVVFQVS